MQKPKKILYEESLIKFSGKSRNVLALIVIGLSSVHFVAFFCFWEQFEKPINSLLCWIVLYWEHVAKSVGVGLPAERGDGGPVPLRLPLVLSLLLHCRHPCHDRLCKYQYPLFLPFFLFLSICILFSASLPFSLYSSPAGPLSPPTLPPHLSWSVFVSINIRLFSFSLFFSCGFSCSF